MALSKIAMEGKLFPYLLIGSYAATRERPQKNNKIYVQMIIVPCFPSCSAYQ
jgi:hypothetical protein